MVRIVADDKIPFLEGALDGVAKVESIPGGLITKRDLLHADGLITRTRTRCNRELLEGTGVRFIASATIGFDHIDTAYCESAGIRWTNAPGCNSGSVRQYIVSSLLSLATRRSMDLGSLTLGVVGVGHVGSKVVKAAEALGMNVLQNDPPRQRKEGGEGFMSLEELLTQADIVTLHVPLNRGGKDNTFRMVNGHFLRQMKKGAILINTSRGSVVDEEVLFRGVHDGQLSDVVLDVFDNEPGINQKLLDAITIGTPHIAGYSLDGKANGTTMSVRAISRFFRLGMDRWKPASIPEPASSELFADASGRDRQDLVWEVFRQTYDVNNDHQRLSRDPSSFERLRGDYPFRREPEAYSVRVFQGFEALTTQLEQLGFSVLADHCS